MYASRAIPRSARGVVNPARRSFNLAKETNRRFVQNDVAFAVAPLRAKFFVAKGRHVTERLQDLVQLLAILNAGLGLDPALVPGHLALGFVGQQPAASILAQAQQFAALSQRLTGKVVQSVAFVRPPSDLPEARLRAAVA